jgi:hypothetical protein
MYKAAGLIAFLVFSQYTKSRYALGKNKQKSSVSRWVGGGRGSYHWVVFLDDWWPRTAGKEEVMRKRKGSVSGALFVFL